MFGIFSSTHVEQRAVLFGGSEELSIKTAKQMLTRLHTNYYNDTEWQRAAHVLAKLGYPVPSRKQESKQSKISLLDKANKTIRSANSRINDIKIELSMAELQIEELKTANQSLTSQLLEFGPPLTDRDILGFESLPGNQVLRKRYKSLALIHHPDKGGSKAMMKRINYSFEKLKTEVE